MCNKELSKLHTVLKYDKRKKNCQIKVLFIYIFLNRRVWKTFHYPLCNRVEDHQAFTLKSWLGSISFPEPPTFPLGERQRNTVTAIWIEGSIVRIKHIRVIHVWIWNVPHFCVLTWSLSGALVGEAVESLGFWAYLLDVRHQGQAWRIAAWPCLLLSTPWPLAMWRRLFVILFCCCVCRSCPDRRIVSEIRSPDKPFLPLSRSSQMVSYSDKNFTATTPIC